MNIDYSEIITKANARKDALQALTKELESAEGHAADLLDALDYFSKLESLIQMVDDEGRNMLNHIPARVLAVAHACSALRRALLVPTSSSWVSMPGLLESVRTPGDAA